MCFTDVSYSSTKRKKIKKKKKATTNVLTTGPGQQAAGSLLSSDESCADPVSLSSGFEVAVGSNYKEGRPRREGSQLPPRLSRVLPHAQRYTPLGCSLSELFPAPPLPGPFSTPAVEQLPGYL